MSSLESALTIPQSINILHQAVLLGQKAGIYSLNDATLIKKSLDSLRYRLHLDENFNPVGQQTELSYQNQLQTQHDVSRSPQSELHPRQIVPVQDLSDSVETSTR